MRLDQRDIPKVDAREIRLSQVGTLCTRWQPRLTRPAALAKDPAHFPACVNGDSCIGRATGGDVALICIMEFHLAFSGWLAIIQLYSWHCILFLSPKVVHLYRLACLYASIYNKRTGTYISSRADGDHSKVAPIA